MIGRHDTSEQSGNDNTCNNKKNDEAVDEVVLKDLRSDHVKMALAGLNNRTSCHAGNAQPPLAPTPRQ